jgi:hypothetical protein
VAVKVEKWVVSLLCSHDPATTDVVTFRGEQFGSGLALVTR